MEESKAALAKGHVLKEVDTKMCQMKKELKTKDVGKYKNSQHYHQAFEIKLIDDLVSNQVGRDRVLIKKLLNEILNNKKSL